MIKVYSFKLNDWKYYTLYTFRKDGRADDIGKPRRYFDMDGVLADICDYMRVLEMERATVRLFARFDNGFFILSGTIKGTDPKHARINLHGKKINK